MSTNYPICPHCNHEYDSEELWYPVSDEVKVSTEDQDESEPKCPSCGKVFKVVCIHEIKFQPAEEF